MRRLLGVIFILFGFFGVAQAHAVPTIYSPESGSLSTTTPENISITFSERVDPSGSFITILFPDSTTAQPLLKVKDESPRTMKVGVGKKETGTHVVTWGVVSKDDGHFTQGAYAFSVGTSTKTQVPLTTIHTEHSSDIPEGSSIFFEIVGEALLLGILLLRPEKKWYLWAVVWCVTMGCLGYIAITGTQLGVFTVAKTAAGSATLWRLVIVLCAVAVSKKYPRAAWALLIAAAYIRGAISHAAASPFFPQLSILMNTVHLLAKEAWIGVLLIFVLEQKEALYGKLQKISAVALAVGGVTGCYITWLHLKNINNISLTVWGARFAVLLLISFFFLGVHLLQLKKPRWSLVYAETVLGVIVLFLSSLLIITTPPLESSARVIQTVENEKTVITLDERAQNPEDLTLSFSNLQSKLNGVPFASITNQEKNVGPLPIPLTQRGETTYSFPRSLIALNGNWRLDIEAPQLHGYDITGTMSLQIPQDIAPDTGRHVDTLAIFSLLAALDILILARWLYKSEQKEKMENGEIPYKTLVGVAIIVITFSSLIGRSPFQNACQFRGDIWEEAPAANAGIITDSRSLPGCTTSNSNSLYHFVDQNEYLFFVRPAKALITLQAPGSIVSQKETVFEVAVAPLGDTLQSEITLTEQSLRVFVFNENFETMTTVPVTVSPKETFQFSYTFPKDGVYFIAAETTVRSTTVSSISKIIAGKADSNQTTHSIYASPQHTEDYSVSLSGQENAHTKTPTPLLFRITKDGKDVTDLKEQHQNLLDVVAISTDGAFLSEANGRMPGGGHNHTLGAVPENGPDILAPILFPAPGTYELFATFQHQKQTHTVHFTVTVQAK